MVRPRPTFSEHWHRVAPLRPSLRVTVQSYRQHFRGQLWHVLRDPTTNRYVRVSDAGFRFVGMLDGRRTTDAVWRACCEQLGDSAPTQNEALQLLGQLYASNLLAADLPADAAGMFERRRRREQSEVGQYLMNLLFARIPLWNPDRFLDRWVMLVGWCFGPIGIALWMGLLWLGFNALAGRTEELWSHTGNVLAPENLLWLYLTAALLKLIHELGHGFACKHFGRRSHSGGHVYTMGIMLLVFMPLPYVDASSAWALRSKWRRAFIGAAGMYAELAVAAVAALVWAHTAAGTVWHALAFNTIFLAGVSTLLFNLNPLIRFDGYYILSDLTDTPNLMQRSHQAVQYLVKKYAFGVRHPLRPSAGMLEMVWLVIYAGAALTYRVFLTVTILLFVADKFFFVGAVLGLSGLIGWVLAPCVRFLHYLTVHPELMKTRFRATAVTLTAITLTGGTVGFIPAPDHGRAEGVVEARVMHTVHAAAQGEIRQLQPSGVPVAAERELLVDAGNPDLRAQQAQLQARLDVLRHRYHRALQQDPAAAQALHEQQLAIAAQLTRVERDLAHLSIAAPHAGVWIADPELAPGAFVQRGQRLGQLIQTDDLYVRISADQYLGPLLQEQLAAGTVVQLRGRRQPDLQCTGLVEQVVPGGRRQLPSAALGIAGGGRVPVRMGEGATGTEAAEPFFEVTVALGDDRTVRLLPGQRVIARFRLPDAPLGVQWWRAFRQTLQQRFQV